MRSRFRAFARRVGVIGLNVWLCVHLVGIFITPATVGASSRTSRAIWEYVGPYLQLVYLNHGFHYFSPEPGGSNLLEYTLVFPGGREVTETVPNRDIAPRLLYHRHFMLTEVLGNSDESQQRKLAFTYARQLTRKYGAESAKLTLVRHELSRMPRIRAGGQLTDEDLYTRQDLGTFRAASSGP